jgi:hypothetical protein
MKIRRISLAFVFTVALAITIAALGSQSSVQGSKTSAPALEGTWDVVRDTDPPGGSLTTYTRGGGLVMTAPGLPPPTPFTFSPGHGAWERAGGHEFAISWQAQFFNNGVFRGMLKVREVITLNEAGDAYEGRQSFVIINLAGNPIPGSDGCVTLHATRINVEPSDPSCQ